jgi:hypothetical protein
MVTRESFVLEHGRPDSPDRDDSDRYHAMLDWALDRELVFCPHGTALPWIAFGEQLSPDDVNAERRQHRWLQNVTGWSKHGNPGVLAAHVYLLDVDDLQDLIATCRFFGLRCWIELGWHGPGSIMIELRSDPTLQRDDRGRPLIVQEHKASGFDWMKS